MPISQIYNNQTTPFMVWLVANCQNRNSFRSSPSISLEVKFRESPQLTRQQGIFFLSYAIPLHLKALGPIRGWCLTAHSLLTNDLKESDLHASKSSGVVAICEYSLSVTVTARWIIAGNFKRRRFSIVLWRVRWGQILHLILVL